MDRQFKLIKFPLWEFRRKGIEVSIFAKLATSRPIITETDQFIINFQEMWMAWLDLVENSIPLHMNSRTILDSVTNIIAEEDSRTLLKLCKGRTEGRRLSWRQRHGKQCRVPRWEGGFSIGKKYGLGGGLPAHLHGESSDSIPDVVARVHNSGDADLISGSVD